MKKFVLALVCAAMVFLVPSTVRAEMAFYRCVGTLISEYKDGSVTRVGANREFEAASEPEAIEEARSHWYYVPPKTHVISTLIKKYATNIRCEKQAFSRKKAKREAPYVPPPPIPPAQAVKPATRTWVCRVKLTWQVGPRKGNVDETWDDIEAASEGEAMGKAIARSQARLKALSLAGTNPAWPATDAKCQ